MTINRINNWILPLAVALIIAAYFIIFFYRGFNDPDEGRYSEIPREMVVNGNWMEMRMLGFRYYEKPPLAYWLVAPAIKVFGPHDWAVRIPLLISGLLGLAVLWALAVKKMGRQHGATAVLVMVSTVGFFAGNGLLLTDSFLLSFFAVTCVFLYLAFDPDASPSRRLTFMLLGAVASVFGFLTKGAVAVVLPAAIIFIWILWERRPKALFGFPVFITIVFLAALILPVLWLIEKHNPGFVRHFIYEEHIARFQGTRAIQLHPEPFWFFLKVLPLLLLPWTLFLFRTGRAIWKQKVFGQDSFSRFLFVWAALVICFFSASTGKLMSYILPAIPPLGLLIGRWGVSEPGEGRGTWDYRLWRIGVAGFFIVAAVIVLVWCVSYFRIWPEKIYPITGISVVALLPIAIGILLNRNFMAAAGPEALALPMTIDSDKGRAAASTPRRLNFEKLLLFNSGILLACAFLLSPLAGKDFNALFHINSSYVYKSLARELKPEDKIVVFWSYRPALPFYTRRLYVPFQEHNELSYGMKMEPERPADLDTVEEITRLWDNCSGRIFAVVEPQGLKSKFPALKLTFKETSLPRDPDTIIYELVRPLNGGK